MSKIDEIMGAAMTLGDQRLMATHNRATRDDVLEAETDLREMIAAALADSRREGAEAMRGACAQEAIISAPTDESARQIADNISALPLPTGPRQAVLLTDEQVSAMIAQHWGSADIAPQSACGFARSIESAVLAANNLEMRRG